MIKNSIPISLLSIIAAMLAPSKLHAMCPLCTLAVGISVSFSKYLGIDDSITGLWIGGFTASLIAWTINFLTNRGIKFLGRKLLVTVFYAFLILYPLYHYNFINNPSNKLWGFDKLLLGIGIGMVVFALGSFWYNYLKKNNNGHAYFPFQKVLMPVGLLMIMSIIFYSITK